MTTRKSKPKTTGMATTELAAALALPINEALARAAPDSTGCEFLHDLLNGYLARQCRDKANTLPHADGTDAGSCPCVEGECQVAKIPDYRPCISVRWGDSPCDCLESDDLEVLCITVCNCYSNISFSGLSIAAIYVTDAVGNVVPDLPGGGQSVQALPIGPLCFGDIPPCVDGQPGCVSRQFVLRTRGARAGGYRLNVLGVCYDICTHHAFSDAFNLNICAD
jgi:hypothetical protein